MQPASPQQRRNVHIGIVCVLVGAIGFSGKPVLVKAAYQYGVDTTTLLALRMLFSAPWFLAMAWWAGRPTTTISRREIAGIITLGFIGYYLASFLDTWCKVLNGLDFAS